MSKGSIHIELYNIPKGVHNIAGVEFLSTGYSGNMYVDGKEISYDKLAGLIHARKIEN